MKEPPINNYIRLWRFQDAPEELRKLSPHGGDEDWLAFVPPILADNWEVETFFETGGREWSRTPHPRWLGYVIWIQAHA